MENKETKKMDQKKNNEWDHKNGLSHEETTI